jgi:hypothetical protein
MVLQHRLEIGAAQLRAAQLVRKGRGGLPSD